MAKSDPEVSELKEQLTDALAQVESLQSAVADAEARAATEADQRAGLAQELEATRSESEQLSARLRDAALRYREARLEAAPHIPSELVTGEEIEEIDEQLTAAEQVASRMREEMEKGRQSRSVPAGAPVRRSPDYSQLPAGEKIRLGLQESGR